MKSFNFYHLTDLHYYANEIIGSYGKYYELREMVDQKCVDKSGAIIDSAFKSIAEDKETEIVLISGDLTYDGEVQSHDALVEKLAALKNKGKKVYVTFATHDFHMEAKKFTDDGEFDLPKYTRAELREKYTAFGFDEAIAEHKNSYSYCVQLTEDVRLLALNDDGDCEEFCGYYDDLLEWIKLQVEDANKAGCKIFAMTHHPVLEPSPIYPLFFHRNMLGGYESTAPYLADLGIEYIFVGHTHIHDINCITTNKGNKIYQINTAALSAYPLAYRKINFSDNGMDVKSVQVEKIDADTNGLPALEYAKKHFISMVELVFETLENDYEKFIMLSKGFSGNEKMLRKFRPVMQKLGSVLNSLTFKRFCKLFCSSKYLDKSIEDKKIVRFMCDVIINLYSGNEIYSPDTAEYKAFIPVCKKIGKIVKLKDAQGNSVELDKLIAGVIYDDGIGDINAFLPSKT